MKFRTEIEHPAGSHLLSHDEPVVLLGSCFSDEIGRQLSLDGFDVVHNPLGPLYNPVSIANLVRRTLEGADYTETDFVPGPQGMHCLDYASRYSGADFRTVANEINRKLYELRTRLSQGATVIITLGSAFVYRHIPTGRDVGNCHKFPGTDFIRRRISYEDCSEILGNCTDRLLNSGAGHIIITVSPIRHLADGLAGNSVSKSTLRLAADTVVAAHPTRADYFPSYEIMLDDLRDYRFYAADMKHPSPTAVEYIYDIFSSTYFDRQTASKASGFRKLHLQEAHRPIIRQS